MRHFLYFTIFTLSATTALATTKPTQQVDPHKYIRSLAAEPTTFANVLCEGIYASIRASDKEKQALNPSQLHCYSLMTPLVQKHIKEHAKNVPNRATLAQINKHREIIGEESTIEYLHHYFKLPKVLYLDEFKQKFPITYCNTIVQNKILHPHKTLASYDKCVHYVTPLVDACLKKHIYKIPKEMQGDDIERFGYLVGVCSSIRFTRF